MKYDVYINGGYNHNNRSYGTAKVSFSYVTHSDYYWNYYNFEAEKGVKNQSWYIYAPGNAGYYEATSSCSYASNTDDYATLDYPVYVFWDLRISSHAEDRFKQAAKYNIGLYNSDTVFSGVAEGSVSGLSFSRQGFGKLSKNEKMSIYFMNGNRQTYTGNKYIKRYWHDCGYRMQFKLYYQIDTLPPDKPTAPCLEDDFSWKDPKTNLYNARTEGSKGNRKLYLNWNEVKDNGPLLQDFVTKISSKMTVDTSNSELTALLKNKARTISGIDKYRLYIKKFGEKNPLFVREVADTETTMVLNENDSDLKQANYKFNDGEKYVIWLVAVDKAGFESPKGDEITIIIDNKVANPSGGKITVGKLQKVNDKEIYDVTFSWDAVKDVGVKYQIFLGEKINFDSDSLTTVTNPNHQESLEAGRTYYAWVQAIDGTGNISSKPLEISNIKLFTEPTSFAKKPEAYGAIVADKPFYQVTLYLQANPEIASYYIERQTEGEEWQKIANVLPSELQEEYTYVDSKGLKKHATYYYRITAVNSLGIKSAPSAKVEAKIPNIKPVQAITFTDSLSKILENGGEYSSSDGTYTFKLNSAHDEEGDIIKFYVEYKKAGLPLQIKEGYCTETTIGFPSAGKWSCRLIYTEFNGETAVVDAETNKTNEIIINALKNAEGVAVQDCVDKSLEEDAVWNGTYYLYGKIEVPVGVSLTIVPGTKIIIAQNDSSLVIDGDLIIAPSEGDILFSVLDEVKTWDGILINGNATLKNIVVEKAVRGLTLVNSDVSTIINQCTFRSNKVGLHIYNGNPKVNNCSFKENIWYGIKEDKDYGALVEPIVTHCSFINNGIDYYDEALTEVSMDELNNFVGNSANTK